MKVQLRESKATNVQGLQQDVTRLWVLMMDDSQYLRNLVESMPRRLEDVIRREGNPSTSQKSSTPNGPFLGPKSYQ
jgi:hypothetical protein